MDVTVEVVAPQITVDIVTTNPVVYASTVNLNTPVPGKSAYQSAVDNGFVGTEAEWAASLGGGPGDGVALVSYDQVSGLPNYPNVFPPEDHNHDGVYVKPEDLDGFITQSDLPDLSEYSIDGHSHEVADVSGLQDELDTKIESANESISGIEFYPSVDDLPLTGQTGVLYVVPVEG